VRADATQLQQVLLNLYTNAWHAMPTEAARIETGLDTCTFELTSPNRPPELLPGTHAHLWVRDNGQGMTPLVRSRIFEPFFTTKPTGQGTGLGLSAVRSIVAAHHGAIAVESEAESGTTFHIYLPMAPQLPTVTAPVKNIKAVAHLPRSLHALYVDDDEPIAILAKKLLERAGFRVTTFTHAEQALAAVRAHAKSFDLMVTDFNMPGMSGIELARRVQSIRSDMPIAIVSGYIDAELRKQAHALHIHTLINKERVVDELGQSIRDMMTTPP
jgi:CheY-like chemotaxis protein